MRLKGTDTLSCNGGVIQSALRLAVLGRGLPLICFLFLLTAASWLPVPAAAQTELGSEDDLTVLGTDGSALDPDTEIKGFTVFGSTQTEYTGAVIGPGNVVVNGVLTVSSGVYVVGASTFTDNVYIAGITTFTDAGNIFIADGNDNEVLAKDAASGRLKWTAMSAAGDSMGDHIATTTLNMSGFDIYNISTVTLSANVFLSSASAALGGGVYVSSNVYIAGVSSAAYYYGNGANLTNLTAANIASGLAPISITGTADRATSAAKLSDSDMLLQWGGSTLDLNKGISIGGVAGEVSIFSSHIHTEGNAPVLTECGTGPSITGNDQAFTVTGGEGAGGCVITFDIPWQFGAPHCVISQRTMSYNPLYYAITDTAITITQTDLGIHKLDVICAGNK